MKKLIMSLVLVVISALGYSQTAEEYFDRGYTKFKLKDYEGSILDLTKVIEIESNNADAYYNRASAKDELQDYIGAIADCNKALAIKPSFAKAYGLRGKAKNGLGDYRGAIADFNKTLNLDPLNKYVHNNRGNAKYHLKDYKGAILDYTKSIAFFPDSCTNEYYFRGKAKINLGQKDSGCLDFSKAGEQGDRDAYEAIAKHCN